MLQFLNFFLKFKSKMLLKIVSFFLIPAYAMTILDLFSLVRLTSLLMMLPKFMKYSTMP